MTNENSNPTSDVTAIVGYCNWRDTICKPCVEKLIEINKPDNSPFSTGYTALTLGDAIRDHGYTCVYCGQDFPQLPVSNTGNTQRVVTCVCGWQGLTDDTHYCSDAETEDDIPEFSLPGDGEKIVAVLLSDPMTNTQEYLCYDCALASITPRPTSQADYLKTAEGFQDATGIVHTFLTEKYDMLWSESGDTFIGQKCETCHAHLGGWQECKCGDISFPDSGPHDCTLWEDDPEEWENIMSGFSDGYVED